MGLRHLGTCLIILAGVACAPQNQDVNFVREELVEDNIEWPKEILCPEAQITVYQPQLETFKDGHLTCRAAVSVTKAGVPQPVFGAVWIEARILTNRDHRVTIPVDVKVTDARFPQDDPNDAALLRTLLAREIPQWRLSFPLDHLLTELDLLQREKAEAQGLKNDPPQILFRSHSAVLVSIEGDPAWRALPGTPYLRIANSSFFMLQDSSSGQCYLHIAPYWWRAADPRGPWQTLESVPAALEETWERDPKPDLPSPVKSLTPPSRPELVVSTKPAELVWTDGPSQYAPIAGTDLLYVKNTDRDIFLDVRTQTHYLLLSGRWYRSAGNSSAWSYIPSEQLPRDFARIPVGSEKQHVLASVAGTPQAREALLDAQIPQTAAVQRGRAWDLEVIYDGPPQFVQIDASPVRYALNTPYAVFQTNGRYYCCQEGIWYESEFPTGPWLVCDRVPSQIYLIPPSCPHYYCTYCHVWGAQTDWVDVGFYPGYLGCYAWGPTVVYGTGWDYPSWRGAIWYPRPLTWGVGVRYNLYTCNWTFSLGAEGPYAWMGLRSYPSEWRGYSVSVGIGGCWRGVGYHPRDIDVRHNMEFRSHVSNHAELNIYARHPERLAPGHHQLLERIRPAGASRGFPNNVYSDHDGNIYRKPAEGGWERRSSQAWEREGPGESRELPHLEPNRLELERRHQSRTRGEVRTRNYSQNSNPAHSRENSHEGR